MTRDSVAVHAEKRHLPRQDATAIHADERALAMILDKRQAPAVSATEQRLARDVLRILLVYLHLLPADDGAGP
jgi:hypothetical protein